MKRLLTIALLAVLVAANAALTVRAGLTVFEDGSGRLYGVSFCIPGQLCDEGEE